MTRSYDVFVVGGGGTGSEVAGRLADADRSLKIGMAERDRLGGECNWYGCVPTKAMLHATQVAALASASKELGLRIPRVEIDPDAVRDRVLSLVRQSTAAGAAPFTDRGVDVLFEEVRLTGPDRLETASGEPIHARNVVLATGSETVVPQVPGLADGGYWTNVEAIWHEGPPPSSLLIIGAGAVGTEFAQIYSRFGTEVVLVEAESRILPGEEEASANEVAASLADDGVHVLTGSKLEQAHRDGRWHIMIDGRSSDVDQVLVASGRRPALTPHDLRSAGIELDDHGHPKLGDTLRSTCETVWFAGDATGELLFTHVGTYEAGIVVDDILGRPRPKDYRVVPRVTFTDPELAGVGLTEAEARANGIDVITGITRFADVERAMIDATPTGQIKLIADRGSGELVGGHIVGPSAGELIHEVVIAMTSRMPVTAFAGAIHAYPTLAEGVLGAFNALADQLR
jgi:pyruvate/2-oxoglutarate dehydrogenase complex dihydrolipoamide dehydrogenase (E3) component